MLGYLGQRWQLAGLSLILFSIGVVLSSATNESPSRCLFFWFYPPFHTQSLELFRFLGDLRVSLQNLGEELARELVAFKADTHPFSHGAGADFAVWLPSAFPARDLAV